MFEALEKKDPSTQLSQTLTITYPRTVDIIYGNYNFPSDIFNLINEINNNISKECSYKSNVKGNKTEWKTFIDHPFTNKFMRYCISKHQNTHPNIFKNFYSAHLIEEAWGNELKKEDYIEYHYHDFLHCILYLTDGEPLLLPELNLKIYPKEGDYYFFPSQILHGMNKSMLDKKRYTFVLNIRLNSNQFDNKTNP